MSLELEGALDEGNVLGDDRTLTFGWDKLFDLG